MKSNLRCFFLFMLIIIMNSCKVSSLVEFDLPEDSSAENIKIESAIGSERLRYSDVYSKVEYIQLETIDESLVSEVSKLEVLDDGKLVVFDKKLRAIMLFDKKGKYLNRIGRRGNGHGEYAYPVDVAYDRYHNHVIVFDSSKSELLYFDMTGHFLSSIRVKWFVSAFSILDKSHLCLFLNHYGPSSSVPITNDVVVIDHSGNIVSQDLIYDKDLENFHPETSNTFTSYKSDTYLKPPFSSIVYDMKANIISPAYYFDFGKNAIPRDWISGTDWTLIGKIRQSPDVTYLRSFYKAKDWYVLSLTKGGIDGICFIERSENKKAKVAFSMSNDIYGFESSIVLRTIHKNKCYMCLYPSNFETEKKLLKLKGVEHYTIDESGNPIVYTPTQKDKDFVNSINDTDNPIIQVCTLREL